VQHVVLSKSGTDVSTYLINDIEDPLQRSLATLDPSLDLSDVLMIDPSHLATLPYGQGLQGTPPPPFPMQAPALQGTSGLGNPRGFSLSTSPTWPPYLTAKICKVPPYLTRVPACKERPGLIDACDIGPAKGVPPKWDLKI